MSYPESAPARRPAAVLSAATVLLVMAVAALAYAVVDLVVLGGTVDAFRSAARDTSASPEQIDDVVTLLRASAVLSAVVAALSAPLLAGLALGLLAGRNGVRVATWVVSGLGLLGGCCSVAVVVGERAAPLQLGSGEQAARRVAGPDRRRVPVVVDPAQRRAFRRPGPRLPCSSYAAGAAGGERLVRPPPLDRANRTAHAFPPAPHQPPPAPPYPPR